MLFWFLFLGGFGLLYGFVSLYCFESMRCDAMNSIHNTKKKNNNEMLTKDSTSQTSAFRCTENVNADDISLEEKVMLISRIKELEKQNSELENEKERC